MKLATAALLFALASVPAWAQVNAGDTQPQAEMPFNMTTTDTFGLPWRIAFLPDGQMLVTEKIGPVWLVSAEGEKIAPVGGTPSVFWQSQNGMLGVYVSPTFVEDNTIYLTYVEPGDYGGGLALGKGQLNMQRGARLTNFEVIWRQLPRGMGGQPGGALAFSPDGQYLFLTVGDRQRFTPAQDPDKPVGKVLRLTLDGKPAPGNPYEDQESAQTVSLIDPPRDTEAAKTAPVVDMFEYPATNPNNIRAETWASGIRTPYGLAFSPDGELWEVEHGPRGGDELNLVERGDNFGWPEVGYAPNYNGVEIPHPDTRPEFKKPAIYWVPVVAPGNLMFYTGDAFPAWKGDGFVTGMGTQSINRIEFDGNGGATPAERWRVDMRVRDMAQAPDGTLWMIEDANPGRLVHVTPK